MFRHRGLGPLLIPVVVILSCGFVVVSLLRPVSPRCVSRESLRSSFDADMRNVVYAWDPTDPRPAMQRRQALFEFVYEGYRSSVWVPQASLEGNWLTRAVLGDSHAIASDRVGLVPWPENQVVAAYGMAPNPAPGQPLGWSINCLACHMAEIDGVAYFGAGTKMLDETDPGRHGQDGHQLRRTIPAPTRRARRPDGGAHPRGDGPSSSRPDRSAHLRPLHGVPGFAR